jgi:type I restriction enzyme, S subunit
MTNWQTKKLGDIATIKRGGSPRPIQDYLIDNDQEGYSWLKIGDVPVGSRYIYETSVKIKPEGLKKTTLVKKGEFILSNSMSFGRPYIMMTDACIHDGWLALQDIDQSTDKNFLYYLLASEQMQNKFKNYSAGSGVLNLKKETVQEIDFKSPEKPEQERIVGVLEVWDEYIEKLEQKIALKEQLKKGLMQQLLTGKRRLPGFTKEWEKRRFADIADVARGKMLTSTSLTQGKYPVVAGGKTSPYSHGDYTHEDVVTVSGSGASAGYVAYHGYKIWASDCSVVEGKNGVSITKYLSLFLKYNQERLYALQSGGAQPHVYPSDIKMLNIELPEISEQESIVKVLCVLDEDIEKLSDKSSSIKLQKKYLLKNLIAGTIRTPEDLQPLDTSRLERSAL